ncbi:MAG: DNA primase [Deltaproteobacteria bacterium]|nr:DNA primase [Deltaproteobacteria bacterium]
MTIPKEKIEEVRDRTNIVQVISEYLPLKKRGKSHIGLCPFHSEKTQSFTVSEEKKIYYCFGCNATGNAVTFVMKKEGMDFPEALRSLARRYGVDLGEEKRSVPGRRDRIYHALKASSEYFVRELHGPIGKAARDYLGNRGYEGEIISRFNLGFAPNRWDGLAGHLRKNGVPMDVAEGAGLVVRKEKGHYDRFRGRIIFPITDLKGRVAGFGGRGIDDNTQPKYLNSPESEVFKKGEMLYGLFQARQSVMRENSAIVVEGYFDLLALHRDGFTNSVATMGTALTLQHLRALKGYAGTVYALFDSDDAGRNAAIRSLPLFLEEEVACRAVILPSGKDPDEFLRTSGPQGLKHAIAKADPLMEFYLKELVKKTGVDTPEAKRRYFNGAMEFLPRVKNVAERGHYSAIVASTVGINVDSVYEALKARPPHAAAPGAAVRDAIGVKGSSLKELTILKVLLKHPELYNERVRAAVDAFKDPALKEAGSIIVGFCSAGRTLDPAAIMDEIKDGRAAGLLFKDDEGFVEAPEQMLEDCLKGVLRRGRMKDATVEMLRQLEQTGMTDVARQIKDRVSPGNTGKR